MNYLRNGDHYFHEINELPKNLKEVKVKSNKFVFGVGEGSNHIHSLTLPKLTDYKVFEDDKGNRYFSLSAEASVKHTLGDTEQVADHKEIVLKPGLYIQVPEKELDLFEGIERKVID